MRVKNKLFALFMIVFITIILLITKHNISFASTNYETDFEYKLGDGALIHQINKDNNTIYAGIGTHINEVSNKETVFKEGQGENGNPSFYCVSKDYGLPTRENSGYYYIKYYIEINAKGCGIIEYNGGNTELSLDDWDQKPSGVNIYKFLYYLLAEEKSTDNPYGYQYDGVRQNAIWDYINSIMEQLGGEPPKKSENNKAGSLINGLKTFETNAIGFSINPWSKINKTVRIWYLEDRSGWIDATNGFCQSFLAVTVTGEEGSDEIKKGSIKVLKKDSDCKCDLTGAKIKIYDNTIGKYINNGQEWEILKEGGVKVDNLVQGHTYTIYEIKTPEDHQCNNKTYTYSSLTYESIKLDADSKEIILYNKHDGPTTGSITFYKKDKKTNQGIKGIYFDLHKETGEYVSTKMSEDGGLVKFENINFGKYYIRETDNESKKTNDSTNAKGTMGYTKNIGFRWTGIEVSTNKPNVVLKDFYNTNYGGLSIEKKDSKSGELISGADITFRLYKREGNNYVKTNYICTTNTGKATFIGNAFVSNIITEYCIEPGSYVIFETKNEKLGYELSKQENYVSDIGVLIGDVVIEGGKINTNYTRKNSAKNTQYGKITIKKVDQNGKPISGIYFDLIEGEYNKEGGDYKAYKTGHTDEQGILVFEKLNINTYTLRETNNSFWKEGNTDTIGYSYNIGKTYQVKTLTKENPEHTFYFNNPIENVSYGAIILKKVDKYTSEVLPKEIRFALYNRETGKRVVFYDWDSEKRKVTSRNYMSTENGIATSKTYINKAKQNTLFSIEPGEYDLYEIYNSNKGYNIRYQGEKYEEGKGALIKEKIKIEKGKCLNLGLSDDELLKIGLEFGKLDKSNVKNVTKTRNAITNEPFVSINLSKYVEKLNNSTNELYKEALEGAGFKLRQGDNYITLRNATDSGKTTEFVSDKDGNVLIERIPVGAIYTLYETKFPEGVDPKIQPGYDPTLKAVKIATIEVGKDGTIYDTQYGVRRATNDNKEGKNDGVRIVQDTARIKNADGQSSSYRSKTIIENKEGKEAKVYLYITNRKYINIKGYVWEDVPNTKVNTYNSTYDGEYDALDNAYSGTVYISNQSPKEKKITSKVNISLKKISNKSTLKTISSTDIKNEEYTFKNVDASQLDDYYIVFDYGNYNETNSSTNNQYITTASNINATNTSKALSNKEDVKDKVKDSNLVERANTGRRLNVILNDATRRNLLYTEATSSNLPTINNINLGIRRLLDPSFSISNIIDHVTISVNGHSFTYNYGEEGIEEAEELRTLTNSKGNEFPKVNWQSSTDYSAYTRSIYPADITTLNSNENDKIKVSVTYRIQLTNNTFYNISDLYMEGKMDVLTLRDTYDSKRYKLNTVDGNWHINGIEGNANYNYRLQNITKGKSADAYITFEVNDEAIIKILNEEFTCEDFPTEAIASRVTHTYNRRDRYWVWSNDEKTATPTIDESNKPTTHQTTEQQGSSKAPYLKFTLSEDRVISGKVFEDTNIKNNNEVVGDGIYDETNDHSVNGVKVELIKYNDDGTLPENPEVAKLYPQEKVLEAYKKDSEGHFVQIEQAGGKKQWQLNDNYSFDSAIYTTGEDVTLSPGEYSFKGVLPGEYAIRFTYGNGTKVIYKVNNEEKTEDVYSNDYKSTIVDGTTGTIYYRNVPDNAYTWYIGQNSTNKAIDNNISFNNDDTIYINQNNEINVNKIATTPHISIPIEFTIEKTGNTTFKSNEYNNMNFGIIKKPKIKIELRKEISNITVQMQNGQNLVTGNPTQNIPYVANLDIEWRASGSKYSKVELDSQYLYGSKVKIEYIITVTNISEITYDSEEYYKYGTNREGKEEAKVTVKDVLECLDPNLKWISSDITPETKEIKSLKESVIEEKAYKNAVEEIEKKYTKSFAEIQEINAIDKNTGGLYTKINGDNGKTTSMQFKINTEGDIYLNEDKNFESFTKVIAVNANKALYSSATDNSDSAEGSAKMIATPSTGLDRGMGDIIATIILLIAFGLGIACMKKIIE